jgi:hypothetical protein
LYSFIESLSAKVHPTPPTIDNLSSLFQGFYATASSHINTHISALASRQNREASPAPSSRASAASRLRAKAASLGSKDRPKITPRTESETQMITSEELAKRKKARKALETKRVLLEEAVERRLCEGIYGRIYRHRSTQDEAQDDKLRSKTAALALVGIGPADLGIDLGETTSGSPEATAEKQEDVRKWLDQARRDLVRMNEKRYPLGKLNHLKAAHKSIVDTLAHFHPSSSADEIMPMLIYTLITLAPENLNVISDLHFIQYFRAEGKLTGEAAYCLTNLEAAISFLETVDLSTLRADEHPSGPPKSLPGTPRTETFPPAYAPGISVASPSPTEASAGSAAVAKPLPSPSGLRATVQLRNRRLSDLVNTPAQAFGAASDTIFTTADQGIKTISNSLGDSYKFLLGKLREQKDAPTESGQGLLVPKTLDDARKLVSTPPPDDEGSVSGASSVHSPEDARPPPREDRVLNLIGGRKASRDHSADSSRSASSSKKVVFADEPREKAITPSPSPAPSNQAIVESMRNLGNSLNPMARLSGISMIRGFGRTTSTPVITQAKDAAAKPTEGGDLATVSSSHVNDSGAPADGILLKAFPEIAAALPHKEIPKVAPPNKRFMELQNPADLKIGEVLELLRDYRRVVGVLNDLGAFESQK